MKKILILPALIFSFSFFSCSTDDAINELPSQATAKNMIVNNINNDQDYAGDIYMQMVDGYKKTYGTDAVISDIINNVDMLSRVNADFNAINAGYTGITVTDVNAVLDNSGNTTAFINGTHLPENVKIKLAHFFTQLESMDTSNSETVNTTIRNFETTVVNDTTLNEVDKDKILVVTAIARYMNYMDSGPGLDRSKWWKFRRTAVCGAVSGVEENVSTAVILSSVIAISENK